MSRPDSIPGMRLKGNIGSKLCVVREPKANSCVPLGGKNQEGKKVLGLRVCQDRGLCTLNFHFLQAGSFSKLLVHRHGTECRAGPGERQVGSQVVMFLSHQGCDPSFSLYHGQERTRMDRARATVLQQPQAQALPVASSASQIGVRDPRI